MLEQVLRSNMEEVEEEEEMETCPLGQKFQQPSN